jgi:hypothetical protein
VPEDSPVSGGMIERILSAISCADDNVVESEAWLSPDGRFRLGALVGAWAQPVAVYIGHAARESARRQRLSEISERLGQLADEMAGLKAAADRLANDRRAADEEWRRAPTDEALRAAHATAVACGRMQDAREKLTEADLRCNEALEALKAARERLATDAADLRLPGSPEALTAIEAALDRYRDLLPQLVQAAWAMPMPSTTGSPWRHWCWRRGVGAAPLRGEAKTSRCSAMPNAPATRGPGPASSSTNWRGLPCS